MHSSSANCQRKSFFQKRHTQSVHGKFKLLLGMLFVAIATTTSAQVAPSVIGSGGIPVVVGVGFSTYKMDYGTEYMNGGTIWADYYPSFLPDSLRGLGIEAEARDINYNRHADQANLRTDTVGGGVIYSWTHFKKINPYGKALASFGSLDFDEGVPNYMHDTRTVTSFGGGVDYIAFRHLRIRGDWEYQIWPDLFRHNNSLDPHGFTIGVGYDFRKRRYF